MQHSAPGDPIVLVSGSDDRFAMPLLVTLYSALTHLDRRRSVVVYILSDGISAENSTKICALLQRAHPRTTVELLNLDVTAIQALVPPGEWQSRASYLRLLIPDVLPRHHARAIYLDSDVVVEGDLAELWQIPLEGHLCAAVDDYLYPLLGMWMPDTCRLLNVPPETPHFNAGVLVIDLERWRAEGIHHKILEIISSYGDHLSGGDQDGLNIVVAGNWLRLDPRWNVQQLVVHQYVEHLNRAAEQPGQLEQQLERQALIMHYVGSRKPWHFRYRGLADDRFFRYLRHSAWFGQATYVLWTSSRLVCHRLWTALYSMKSWARGRAPSPAA